MFTCSWLSARLNDFQQQHPDIHLQISNGDNELNFITLASDQLFKSCQVVPCLDGFSIKSPHEYYLIYPSLTGLSDAANQFRQWLLESIVVEAYAVLSG